MVTVRKTEESDLPIVQEWAERRGCAIYPALLPPHGFMALHDDRPIMSAWAVFLMDCPIVQVDHVYLPRRFDVAAAHQAWELLLSTVRTFVQNINASGGFAYSVIEIMINPTMAVTCRATGGNVSVSQYQKCHYPVEPYGT